MLIYYNVKCMLTCSLEILLYYLSFLKSDKIGIDDVVQWYNTFLVCAIPNTANNK